MDTDSAIFGPSENVVILCCQCSTPIQPNAANMCVNCIKVQANIVDEISTSNTLEVCQKCSRVLQPPNQWITADLESKQLLGICLKRIKGLKKSLRLVDASFLWTEPHSKVVNVKIVVEKEIEAGTILRQNVVVTFIIQNHMCDDCHRTEAQDFWKAVVQVRQKTTHRKTFYYLEQLILKYNQHSLCTNVKTESGGVDFFFAREQEARKFLEFVQQVVPCRYTASRKLKSHDTHDNVYNYKHNFSIEIVPVCRENIVALPKKLAQSLGNLSQLCICIHVTNLITLIDPFTLHVGEVSANVFWREPFSAICTPTQLTEFVIIEVEIVDESEMNLGSGGVVSNRHMLADVYMSRPNEIGLSQVHTRTHLGHLLRPGDTVLGFDFRYSNVNHAILETMSADKIPDAIIVKKIYPNRVKRNRERNWKLKKLGINHRDSVSYSNDGDYADFLEDLEEDPVMRSKVNIYADKGKQKQGSSRVQDHGDGMEVDGESNADEEYPKISLAEMLDDLNLDGAE